MQFVMRLRVYLLLLTMVVAGMCVPTSVLAKNSELNNKGQYRSNNKGYDNLQNILNSEAYLEPFALPLQYSNRYYGDRKKRSNNKLNKYDMRLKRESKLTPADMLALVALVEAGERSRKESEPDTYNIPDTYFPAAKSYYPNSNNNNYEYQNNDDNDISSSWVEPSIVDYYGVPYNVDALPKYEIAREHKYGINLQRGLDTIGGDHLIRQLSQRGIN